MGTTTSNRRGQISSTKGPKVKKGGSESSPAVSLEEEVIRIQQRQEEDDHFDTNGKMDEKNGVVLRHGNRGRSSSSSIGGRSGGSRDSRLSKHASFYEMVDASEINSYLLVGNQACIDNSEFLSRKRVLFVLNLSNLALPSIKEGIHYKSVPIEDEDDQDLLTVIDECMTFLHEAKKKCESTKSRILIYSYFGLSRSCSVALAHLMKEEKWNLRKAWTVLKQCHSSAKPNDGFLLQLLQYETSLHGIMSMSMQDFYAR